MIFDSFKNAHRYSYIPYIQEIIMYVQGRDCAKIPDGEHEILERDLFVRVAEYPTGPAQDKKFEAHQIYADLQLIVAGEEMMGVALNENPAPATAYDEKADIQFFKDVKEMAPVNVSAGQFTVFFPGELHRPGCDVSPDKTKTRIKKLVFKIKL